MQHFKSVDRPSVNKENNALTDQVLEPINCPQENDQSIATALQCVDKVYTDVALRIKFTNCRSLPWMESDNLICLCTCT